MKTIKLTLICGLILSNIISRHNLIAARSPSPERPAGSAIIAARSPSPTRPTGAINHSPSPRRPKSTYHKPVIVHHKPPVFLHPQPITVHHTPPVIVHHPQPVVIHHPPVIVHSVSNPPSTGPSVSNSEPLSRTNKALIASLTGAGILAVAYSIAYENTEASDPVHKTSRGARAWKKLFKKATEPMPFILICATTIVTGCWIADKI